MKKHGLKIIGMLLTMAMLWSCLVSCNQEAVTSGSSESEPSREDMPTVENYEALMGNLDHFPISFKYDDKEFNGFAGFEVVSSTTTEIDRGSKTNTLLRHPEIHCVFELITSVYPYENAYEYVVYIQNDSKENSGVFSSLDYVMTFEGTSPVLKGIKGDAGGQYYTPYSQQLSVKNKYSDRSISGRPTHGTFPYYNLSYGNGGSFIAVGWSGKWRADFTFNKNTNVTTLRTGQYKVSTYVAPGETLRMPLMGIVDYENLTEDEQTNAWRQYYIHDVMRKIDGELTPLYTGISSSADKGKTTNKLLLQGESFFAKGLNPELYWIDAGWYVGANGETVSWPSTGTHTVDLSRFPDGLASVGEFTEENNMLFLLWFEPEIVRLDRKAFLNSQKDFKEEWLLNISGSTDMLVNLGNPECLEWVFGKICNVIDVAGVTGYRQDFNTDPGTAWNYGDNLLENRTGMTENLYVQGYLALWDMLLERYPDLYIDSCASGGGRNDLESMKRAVPLHYSDWFDDDSRRNDYDMKSKMTQALYAWFPYFKNEIYAVENNYQTRMNLAPLSLLNIPNALMADAPWELLGTAYAEHHLVRQYFYADYYQLTEWSTAANRWNGWEFYDPESGGGFAVMFCHETTSSLSTTVKLKGLDKNATYKVYDLDGLVTITATGEQLTSLGIGITVPEKPYGVLMMIERVS